MGFRDLFSVSLTNVKEKVNACIAECKQAAFRAAVQSATEAPHDDGKSLFSTWEDMAKKGEVPVLPADYVRSFKGPATHPEEWTSDYGNCLSHSCGYYCRCGGIPEAPIEESFLEEVPNCPTGRNLCARTCSRHGGSGKRSSIRLVAAPLCVLCDGTGIFKPSPEVLHLRQAARRNRHFYAVPWIDIPDDVLIEGTSGWAFKERFLFGWRVARDLWVDSKTWMQAAAVVKQSRDMAWQHPHLPRQYINHENWYELAASRTAVDAVFAWWKAQRFPGEDITEDLWWKDYTKPCMGFASHTIEKRSKKKTYAEAYIMPPLGDPTLWEMCLNGLANLDFYDPDAEEFEDCLSDFDAQYFSQNTKPMMDLIMKDPGKSGPAVCSIIQARRQLGISEPLVSRKARATKKCFQYNPSLWEMTKELDRLRALMYMPVQPTAPVWLMTHPDQEEIEDQLDHLDQKQGGTVLSTPSFIEILRAKKKDVRGKEFAAGSEGRVKRAEDFVLSQKDVFLPNTLSERLNKMGIVRKFSKETGKLTKIATDLTNQNEVVCYPAKELRSEEDGILTAQVFTVLNRPIYDHLNKLAEAGWKEAKSVVLNLHMRMYLPVHTPIYAFCAIMWGHASDAALGALSGSYVYLGDSEATVLQLPLICSAIGRNLEDFEAYRRSLVLTTTFYGPRGITAGTKMFGITAIEFTEYLPSSHAGITHERDSWEAMLRRHGGMEKQRFIAGFNVVDFIEKGKETSKSFPDFDLQPVPRSQPTVRTFDDEAGPSRPSLRSTSMRVKTFSQFRGPNIPVNHLGDFRDEALSGSGARSSFSYNPRMAATDGCNARAGDYQSFICAKRVDLPKEVSQGTVLAQLDLLKLFRGTSSHVFNRWLSKGYLDTDVRVVSHLAPNRYSGMALWFVMDAYEKFPSALAKTIDSELVVSFPNHMQVLTDPTTSTFILKWDRLVGQSLFIGGDSYARPCLYIVAATSTALGNSAAGSFVVEFFTEGEEQVRSLATIPEMQYPLPASALRDLDLFLPPAILKVGENKIIKFPISFANRNVGPSGYKVYTHAAAILSHFQGIGGILRARIIVTSSQFVTAKLRVCLWNSAPTESTMARIPHVDTEVGTIFELKIQDAFYASSVYGDSGASIFVSPLSTAFAPESCTSDFEFCVHILGIEPDLPLCRTINYSQKFAWFAISPSKSNVEILKLMIYARSVNMVVTKMSVTNYVNPFALMVATTGMHWGQVILHFSWTFLRGKKGADIGGIATIVEGFGPEEKLIRGNVQEIGIYETKCSVPLEFGNFAGPTPSKALTNAHCNWIKFDTKFANELSSLFVTVEVLPGFKFYGRTPGPFNGPTSAE